MSLIRLIGLLLALQSLKQQMVACCDVTLLVFEKSIAYSLDIRQLKKLLDLTEHLHVQFDFVGRDVLVAPRPVPDVVAEL